MRLSLRLHNGQYGIEDAPTQMILDGHGCRAGRHSEMDWVLKDPSKRVSNHHFDIQFRGGTYFISDVSTNGTFLNGQQKRLQGWHAIESGDQFLVGPLVVVAELLRPLALEDETLLMSAGRRLQVPPTWSETNEGLRTGRKRQSASEVPDAASLGERPEERRRAEPPPDASRVAAPLQETPRWIQSPPAPVAERRSSAYGSDRSAQEQAQRPKNYLQQAPIQRHRLDADQGPERDTFWPVRKAKERFSGDAAQAPRLANTSYPGYDEPVPRQPAPRKLPASLSEGLDGEAAFLNAFCNGAGLPPSASANVDAANFAFELGRSLRVVTSAIMSLLDAQDSTNELLEVDDQTKLEGITENPLKAMPDIDRTLLALLFSPAEGHLAGAEGYSRAMHELQASQFAFHSALKVTLENLKTAPSGSLDGSDQTMFGRLDDLTPPDIGGDATFRKVFSEAYAAAARHRQP